MILSSYDFKVHGNYWWGYCYLDTQLLHIIEETIDIRNLINVNTKDGLLPLKALGPDIRPGMRSADYLLGIVYFTF